MNALKSSSRFILFLASFYFCTCSQKPESLSKEYHELAIKLSHVRFEKPLTSFDHKDSLASFIAFKSGLDIFMKRLPNRKIASDENLSIALSAASATMQIILYKHAWTYRDSLTSLDMFLALSQLNLFNSELLRNATIEDFLTAYVEYATEAVLDKTVTLKSSSDLIELLGFSLQQPIGSFCSKADCKAFAFVRRNIIREQLYPTLNEKQKLLMNTDGIAFINSLSDEQAKLFGELKKYSEMIQ